MKQKNIAGYLFVHFIGEQKDGEQVYFALSKDGLFWKDLNGGELMLRSKIGEQGVRDPFVIKSPWEEKYYLIATDLRIEAGKGWEAAQFQGSLHIVVWESTDLVSWQGPRLCQVGPEGTGCVWAPEAIYDKEKDAIMVFFASMGTNPGETNAKQRIYRVYTKDFQSFTKPELYLERDNHVIDTTILETEEGYYRYSKDETTKNIRVDFGTSLEPESFRAVDSQTLDNLYGVEGPEIYPLPQGKSWCLIVDRFATGKGYLPLVTDNLASGDFTVLEEGQFQMGELKKRHGGVLPLEKEEYERLEKLLK